MRFSSLHSWRQSNRSGKSRRGAKNRRKAVHKQRGRLAKMEQLEDRRLLAADWFQQDQVFAFDQSTPEAFAEFGISVAVDGDLMVVGSPQEDLSGGLINAGAAFVYRRDDNGTPLDNTDDFWQKQAKLTASDAAASDLFGHSVSVSADTVVVGSFLDDDAGSQAEPEALSTSEAHTDTSS